MASLRSTSRITVKLGGHVVAKPGVFVLGSRWPDGGGVHHDCLGL